jgi:hypothetical protein
VSAPPRLGDVGVDAGVEQVRDPARLQHRLGVGAGGDDGGLQAGRADGVDVPSRAGVDLDPVALQHLEHQLVLTVGEAVHGRGARLVVGAAGREADVPRLEERLGALEPRLAVDVLVVLLDRVERGLAGLGLQELVEHLLPGGRVHHRGLGHHPVHVEQAGGDPVGQA